MIDAFIYDGVRTPFGRHAGALSKLRPDEMLASAIKEIINRSGVDTNMVEDVIAGDTTQAGEDSRNVARTSALLAGLSTSVAGITLNKLCGSGAAAALDAARAIRCGEGQLIIAGGVESMSRAPWVIAKSETAYGRTQEMYDSTIG